MCYNMGGITLRSGGYGFMPSPTVEDYVERIYSLIKEKGYARVSDIAVALNVHPSTVTRMVQKLDEKRLLDYERYRGLALTPKGERLGKAIEKKHKTLEEFLRFLGIEDEDIVQEDTEGIEHHLSPVTLDGLTTLVEFFERHPEILDAYIRFRQHVAEQTVPID